ncbi:hypothetical protein ACI2IP_09680 [Microbacterium sp. NPDC090218]
MFVRPISTNPGMWLSITIPVAMVIALSQNFDPNAVTTWEAVFASANWGAILGMPLCAAAVAISVRIPSRWIRANHAATNRSLATRTLIDIMPTLIAIAVGYLLSLAIVLLRASPSSAPTLRSFGPLGVFLSMVLVALFIGFVIGRVLPAPIAVVVAALAQYLLISLPLVSEPLEHLRFALGYSLPLVLQTVDQQISSPMILLPMLLGGVVLVALVLASARLRVSALVWTAAAATAILVLSPPLTASITLPGYEARSAGDLHCEDRQDIAVCVWPEFGSAEHDGVPLIDSLATYAGTLRANGIEVGPAITSSSVQAEKLSALMFAAGPGEVAGDELPISIAAGARSRISCPAAEQGTLVTEGDRAVYALAIALGASPDALAQREGETGTGADLLHALGLSTARDGFSTFIRWQEKAADACGKGES